MEALRRFDDCRIGSNTLPKDGAYKIVLKAVSAYLLYAVSQSQARLAIVTPIDNLPHLQGETPGESYVGLLEEHGRYGKWSLNTVFLKPAFHLSKDTAPYITKLYTLTHSANTSQSLLEGQKT
jgi:hypothetical protein